MQLRKSIGTQPGSNELINDNNSFNLLKTSNPSHGDHGVIMAIIFFFDLAT